MRKWSKWIIPGILVLALAGVGVWGYQENTARQALQNRAESQYQRAFYELSWHVDMISGQLAQLLISGSKEQGVIGLASIWRQVFAAQNSIGQLPLAFVSLSQTEKFLSDTGNVSYGLLSRINKEKAGLIEKDREVIEALFERSKVLKEDLASLGAEILNKELSWTQVEVAMLEQNKSLDDNTILDGFDLMEKRMDEYPEINLGEDFSQVKPDVKKVRSDEEITVERAELIARKWWYNTENRAKGELSYEGVGDVPTYGIEFQPQKEGDSPVYIDISKLDGSVIWALKPKLADNTNINPSEGEKKCDAFLTTHGFENMSLVKFEKEDNTGVYTFVPRQGEILLYPDQVKIEVAMDNGEITGYEGTPFYMNHRTRDIKSPVLSEEMIREMVSPALKVEMISPALIANSWGKEVLCWEVRGKYSDEEFAIFYNAYNGTEEEITRITPPPEFEFDLAG